MAEESTKPPKVFISYAWEDDVKLWVRAFAKQLRKDGVEAVLDQWGTRYGDQLPEFMEKAIRESDFVILVCTPKYKKKSDEREGGVGYEGNIITSEIFQNSNHRKFISVLRKGSWGSALPSWAAGKLSMDLSGDPYSKRNYQELLRVLHDKWYTPPPVGRPPDFPDDEDDIVKPNLFAKFLTTLKDNLSEVFTIVKASLLKALPIIRITGSVGVFVALFWAGSLAVPKFIALIPMRQATATATQQPVIKATSTNPPVPPIKTLKPNATPTKTRMPAPTSLTSEITDVKDEPMVLIPAGDFTMGSSGYYFDETPVHNVQLASFYIDKYEVTNANFNACVVAGVCDPPQSINSYTRSNYFGNSEFDNFPVVFVSWNQASVYCEWRGGYLPTEAQWEKAARGTDERTYPWGNEFDSARLNFCDQNCPFKRSDASGDDGYATDTSPVGNYEDGASYYGLYDMAGNVWEWVADWYSDTYYAISPYFNPLGPSSGQERILRGGSWIYGKINQRVSDRYSYAPDFVSSSIGFRCVTDATP